MAQQRQYRARPVPLFQPGYARRTIGGLIAKVRHERLRSGRQHASCLCPRSPDDLPYFAVTTHVAKATDDRDINCLGAHRRECGRCTRRTMDTRDVWFVQVRLQNSLFLFPRHRHLFSMDSGSTLLTSILWVRARPVHVLVQITPLDLDCFPCRARHRRAGQSLR
ncbi:hypothetical protein BGW80DRAFT_443294 [Lactifluus volemus]|nr:hypothetical protein BGW80DRAFT_443294 [Lactifluus volemus]